MTNVSKVTCSYCGVTVRVVDGSKATCPKCTRELRATAWVRWVKMLRRPEDRGVGDTIERMIASVGLDRWKAFSKKLGMPCNCDSRRDWLNDTWPY